MVTRAPDLEEKSRGKVSKLNVTENVIQEDDAKTALVGSEIQVPFIQEELDCEKSFVVTAK